MNEPKKPVLPHGWIVKQSSTYPDRVYYFNVNTGNSTWEAPTLKSELAQNQKPPNTKSCLSKPSHPGKNLQTSKKSVSINAPVPQFSPEATPEGSDDDLFDLNDDGQAAEGHKYHMDILRGFESPSPSSTGMDNKIKNETSKNDKIVTESPDLRVGDGYRSSVTLSDQLACVQDVDMRQGRIPCSSLNTHRIPAHIPNNSSDSAGAMGDPYTNNTLIHSNYSAYTATTLNVSNSKNYGERTRPGNYSRHSGDSVDGSLHFQSASQLPLQLPKTPKKETPSDLRLPKTQSRVPLTTSDQPSFHLSSEKDMSSIFQTQKDMSSSFQTLPSVHSNLLPEYHKMSSTPILKKDHCPSKSGDRFAQNTVYDTDFRITKQIDSTKNQNEGRKRRLSDSGESKKLKKLKCKDVVDNDVIDLAKEIIPDSCLNSKVLSANDLRHKVPRRDKSEKVDKHDNIVIVKRESRNSDPRLTKLKTDVRRVVSRTDDTGCAPLDLKSEDFALRDRSPVDSDGNNVADNIHIDPDKLLSIQTWIDNLQPDPPSSFQSIADDEDMTRTSPDSGVISITYSNDSDNRRIVVAGDRCGQTVDSGISSVSNNTVFRSNVESWQNPLIHPPQIQQNNCWRGVHSQGCVVDHNRDVMDMEIDEIQNKLTKADDREIEAMEVVDIVVKEVRETLKNRSHEVVGMLTEMVSADTQLNSSHSKGLFIVIDTNVLIDHLNFISDLRDSHIPAHGKPVLVFPWVVMQELDYLKTGKTASASMSLSTAKKARESVKYLFHCLQSSHPRIMGQTPTQARLASREFVAESNDDRVLQCCLQCQNNYQDCLVVLLSNDKNLCNKAVIMGIKSFTQQNILSALPALGGIVRSPIENDRKADKPRNHNSNRRQPVETWNQSQTPAKPVENDANSLDDVYCKVKSLIKESLSIILEREMKAVYDDIWLTIVFKKPPWTLKDVLECIKKHWIAVFGQIYNRSLIKSVENLLHNISRGGTVTWPMIEEIITIAVTLLREDMQHKSYNNETARFVKELLDLKSCGIPNNQANPDPQNDRRQTYTSPMNFSKGSASTKSPAAVENNRSFNNNRKSPYHRNRKSPVQNNWKSPNDNNRKSPVYSNRKSPVHSNRKSPVHSNRKSPLYNNWKSPDYSNWESPVDNNRKSPVDSQWKSPNYSDRKSPVHSNRKSPIRSNRKSPVYPHQQPVFSKSEIKLQQIWQTIDTFRAELKSVANESDSPERHAPRLLSMGTKIVPAIKQLLDHYSKALNVPPSQTRSELGNVIGLCEQLNDFLTTVEIEDTEGPIETYDLLDLFSAEDKRSILKKGHVQLKEFINDIYTSLQQLPDESD